MSYIKKKIEKVWNSEMVDYKTIIPKIDVGYSLNVDTGHYIVMGDITLLCDGDIYNANELFDTIGIEPNTSANGEIIIHLYKKYGIKYTLQLLNGIFSFVLVDSRISQEKSRVYIARDPFGIVPLYALDSIDSNVFGFSRNPQILNDISIYIPESIVFSFLPGSYSVFEFPNMVLASWKCIKKNVLYHTVASSSLVSFAPDKPIDLSRISDEIQFWFNQSIEKRSCYDDTPVACMLSGGFSSALIAAFLVEKLAKHKLVETYSIGMKGSDELTCAKKIAEHLGTKHTEIFIGDDITTETELYESCDFVMNSICSDNMNITKNCMVKCILNKYICENSQSKHVFSGDGLKSLICKDDCLEPLNLFDYDNKCRNEIRGNNNFCIAELSASFYGLKTMIPFMDTDLVNRYMSLPIALRYKHNIFKLSFSSKYWTKASVLDYCHDV